MDNQFMMILLIIFGSLVGVGIIVSLILKKLKAHENAVTVSILATSFFGLLAAGVLVYLVSLNMMKDYMGIKRYNTYHFENDDKSVTLTVREYSDSKGSGFELYLDEDKDALADIKTDSYLPFGTGEVQLSWQPDSVTIDYTYQRRDDSYECRSCTLSLKDGKVSKSVTVNKKLEPRTAQQSPEQKAA